MKKIILLGLVITLLLTITSIGSTRELICNGDETYYSLIDTRDNQTYQACVPKGKQLSDVISTTDSSKSLVVIYSTPMTITGKITGGSNGLVPKH